MRKTIGLIIACAGLAVAQNGLTATNLTGDQIALAWQASSGLASPTYLIERCEGKNCTGFIQMAQVPGPAVTFTDPVLDHFSWYMYRVRATDGTNFSPYGRVAGTQTVDLALRSSTGDFCTAVAVPGQNPLATFTCNQQSSPGGLPGLRITTTVNNVNNVAGGVGYSLLSLASTLACLVAVNEDPVNAGSANFSSSYTVNGTTVTSTPNPTPMAPSEMRYSCAVDGAGPPLEGSLTSPAKAGLARMRAKRLRAAKEAAARRARK